MALELFAQDWRELWTGVDQEEPLGAVFTKPEIVDLILDLAGYSATARRLSTARLLEPSCGDGAFLTAIIGRLIESERLHGTSINWRSADFKSAIRAADINERSVLRAREQTVAQLVAAGCPRPIARSVAQAWIIQTDFLLADWSGGFDFVVGNPPYVRLEDVPKRVLMRYRELFTTTTDRADVYVAFFERGLELLSKSGSLAFICANRFTKNRYGDSLRRLLVGQYRVRNYINLEHTQPFLSDVSAYPAIVVADRERGRPTRAATLSDISQPTLARVGRDMLSRRPSKAIVSQFDSWYPGGEPWTSTSAEEHGILDSLNRALPTLEQSAPTTRVGIGVATGADEAFVLPARDPKIELSRQIPLLMASDVANDRLTWSGSYVLNPFADDGDGALVDLGEHPGLSAHLNAHSTSLCRRHVAKNRPKTWYRTIDRIWPALQNRTKLVIPDIQVGCVIGLDSGDYYPHHNVYWITSDQWPLEALKALLRSSLVLAQVRAYSVQMRGGALRFQAQTLRRIRIPPLRVLPSGAIDALSAVSASLDQAEIDSAAQDAFAAAMPSVPRLQLA